MLKQIMRLLLKEYCLYRIYSCSTARPVEKPLSLFRLARIADAQELVGTEAESLSAYAGEGSAGFGAWLDSRLVAACFYWYGERYRQRGFWPLRDKEAKLVQIITAPTARGLGVAPALIVESTRSMLADGFDRVYARIWHSNHASIRAFEKAGWQYTAFVVEIVFVRCDRRVRWVFRSPLVLTLLSISNFGPKRK